MPKGRDKQATHGETHKNEVGTNQYKGIDKKAFLVLFCCVVFSQYAYLSAPRSIRKDGQRIRPTKVQPKDNT